MTTFSIVIPSFNKAHLIPGVIKNIQSQEFTDWELLVIDDGSQDDTEEVIKKFEKESRIRYIKQENQGVSKARNTGIQNARGSFITFLDADDAVTENWLKDFDELLKNSLRPGYLSCGYYINQNPKTPKLEPKISKEPFSSLAGTFAIKREVLNELEGYDTNLKQSENWELTARALRNCEENDLEVLHTTNLNFTYNHNPTPDQTLLRDEYRAEATRYLHEKYSKSGVLFFRKKDFLLSSAVNFTRAEKFEKSRKLFYKNFFTYPSLGNLVKIIIFEIPPLRRRKWMRKN